MTIYQPTIQMKTFTEESGISYEDTYLDSENNIAFIYSIDSVSQTVKNAISLWKNEYQFDVTLGSPWDNILGKPSNRLLLNAYIQNAVLNVPYVTNIISIRYTENNRERIQSVEVKYWNEDSSVGVVNVNI